MIGILSVSSESMATTEIRVKVMAAEDLKKDGRFRKMNVYTLMWIDPTAKQSTRVHRKGGRFPQWNDELVFYLGEDVPIFPHSTITIQVIRQRLNSHIYQLFDEPGEFFCLVVSRALPIDLFCTAATCGSFLRQMST